MKRILAPVSRRVGTALTLSALAVGLATAACSAESTSDAAAPAAATSTAPAPDVTTPGTPQPVDEAVPTAGAALAQGASTNCGNGYAGVWVAKDPGAFIASITISQTDCGRLDTARFRIVSRPWMGLGSKYTDWGYAKNISWGYMGTSVTLTYYFQSGLVEKVYILPAANGSTLSAKNTEYYTNGTSSTPGTEYYNRYGS
ncbi:hypothetical protein I6A84_07120 [Frankia sp. CNm7]|uniref:Lipoprotein n=1 Tax=Frankia nepalensis TaxID=1836974 RepID=A0A937RIF0_9ACTN|nr:hypothetical protein [Frankia nepalensis]MBL7501064.1 hypothetical protein [Frankia nepalensis]MBL7512539.1 hypothetical protein [Frankia nepalensis]MBL7517899.1 hypothetical protein [Frankia nepalensis]MBL7632841.1 hypothetical protein [Frankia nepalensis]